MKRFLLSSALAAGTYAVYVAWSCFAASQASAQPPMGPAAVVPGGIALVDVNYIFKRHVRLRDQLKNLGQEAEGVQKNFEGQLQRLQEQKQQLNQLKVGTPDYQRMEESIVSQQSIIQGQIALKRKEFVQKEAHLYYNAYREITQEVTDYCQQRGVAIVLNFNGDNINEQNADEIARGISNKVVFYNKDLDITPRILPRFIQPINPNAATGPAAFTPAPYAPAGSQH